MDYQSFRVWCFLLCGFWNSAFCDQDGFLSISCGGTTNYVDSSNISWVSDSAYISTGNTTMVDCSDGCSSARVPLRFFPNSQDRKCYKLPVKNLSSLILVRMQFVYKDYDKLGRSPTFTVSLGTAVATTINLAKSDPWTEEFIWYVNKDVLPVCFHSRPNRGSPVISTIEIRSLPQGSYRSGMDDFQNKLLRKSYRINCGHSNGSLRYPLDPYDRTWDADENFTPSHLSTAISNEVHFDLANLKEAPPVAVLQTARVLARKDVLSYNLPLDVLGDYFTILYFAGILPQSPSFDVLINGDTVELDYTVKSWQASALFVIRKGISSLNITLKDIRFHPQLNAIEVYQIVDIPLETSSTTVSALEVIQQSTGIDLGWQDDPCYPTPWKHIGCEENLVVSVDLSNINLRSISPTFGDLLDLKTLDLHNTSLYGEIQNLGSLQDLEKMNLSFNQLTSFGSDIENFINLQVLDLQNNSLQGTVPDSLGELKNLHMLNLENNALEGILPMSLNRESLEVRTSGNLCLSFSTTCNSAIVNGPIETPQVTIVNKKKHPHHDSVAIMVGAISGALIAILLISLLVLLYMRRKMSDVTCTERARAGMRNWNSAKVFTYKEIKSATKNFKEVIGRGSFGSVYLGKLSDGKMVAVKVRLDRSQLGADSFINEVYLLSQILHQNLVSLEGFCCESKQQILVYEYVPGGSLADNLYGTNSKRITLSWVRRLKIAVDAAKGVDYLHNGSNRRIIHRDIKCGNILLDFETNAKLCDFGLSKQVVHADATHVTTIVKGTAGYLDPEYYSTQQLTEKSDVYSFGVVLLELICGREPLRHSGAPDTFNLVLWAKPYLQAGAFEIVDESIKGTFDMESMRKVAYIASRCVERDAVRRPSIADVLATLKDAYSIQLAHLASLDHVV